MRSRLLLSVAARQIWSRSHSGVVRTVSVLSVAGISIGVAALLILDSFMNGFQGSITDFLEEANPPVIVSSPGGGAMSPGDALLVQDLVEGVEGLEGLSPYCEKAAVASGNGGTVAGVVVRGVDPARESLVSGLASGLPSAGESVVLGCELAGRLGVAEGDSIRLASTESVEITAMGRALVDTIVSLRVASIRDFGLAEYNSGLVVTQLRVAGALFGTGTDFSAAGVGVSAGADPVRASAELDSLLREAYVSSRHDRYMTAEAFLTRHANLFRAFGLERLAMTIVLALITVVALLNLSSALSMIALEHKRDIGVLRAMGATPGAIVRLAISQGFLIGTVGCAAGVLLASAAMLAVNRFLPIRLEGSVYWISSLPARVDPVNGGLIVAFTLAACLATSVVPALGSLAVPPGECVRNE